MRVSVTKNESECFQYKQLIQYVWGTTQRPVSLIIIICWKIRHVTFWYFSLFCNTFQKNEEFLELHSVCNTLSVQWRDWLKNQINFLYYLAKYEALYFGNFEIFSLKIYRHPQVLRPMFWEVPGVWVWWALRNPG